jgi:RNA polymerase sigma-70 factor, ECF subfamily
MSGSRESTLVEHVDRLRRGDRFAENVVVAILEPPLRRMLSRILRSTGEVDDALQESLLAFFRALPQFRGETTLPHFALRIARLQAVTRLRAARRERARNSSFCFEQALQAESPVVPDDELVRSELVARLHALCGHLPPEQAQALLLRFIDDRSVSEIAVAQHAPPNTVRTRLRLARSMMRRMIESHAKPERILHEVRHVPVARRTLPR